ncbi:MAG: glycerophosphodiester phosphodiesterase family protein [Sneathiella sp.]
MLSLKSKNKAAPDWLTATPIAHRGLHDKTSGAEENSMTAFLRAKDARLAIEFDVHLSSDFKPIVFHDDNLSRMTSDQRQVAEVSAAELVKLRLGKGADTIPDFQSVLNNIKGDVPLVIELKTSPFGYEKLASTVRDALKDYQGDYSIQSFDPFILGWFRRNAPHIPRGQLAMKSPPKKMSVYKKFIMRHMLLNTISKPHYIGYNVSNISDWAVRRAMRQSMYLLAWTVSTEEQLNHARQFADNIIFENLPLEMVA